MLSYTSTSSGSALLFIGILALSLSSFVTAAPRPNDARDAANKFSKLYNSIFVLRQKSNRSLLLQIGFFQIFSKQSFHNVLSSFNVSPLVYFDFGISYLSFGIYNSFQHYQKYKSRLWKIVGASDGFYEWRLEMFFAENKHWKWWKYFFSFHA